MDAEINLPAIAAPDRSAEIAALARRYRRANGPVMGLVNRLGGSLEARMESLPEGVRRQIETVTERALLAAHGLAGIGARGPDLGRNGPMAAAMLSGAVGGAGGLVTSVAELPVTVTVMLHAIRNAAVEQGFDPDDPAIRAECLRVFTAGSPLASDDGVNTSFLSARLTVTGPALQRLVATVAPKLATALGQKLAAQAVPVLGAVAGAGLNAAFLRYYREMAEIRFALLRLAEQHGAEAILDAFARAVAPKRLG
ncbi:EcsC family protein [Paragemmobacter straminiformis]|uniref:EcsC family protein n=1 Tax=Paragemmobacter straminiformis TaxID=2045119 RepID=A0A842IC57_9RHOB|nr:EcsC family protein [Gemmobacter straminiformis]MBC2837275.1 EcsC family protein [Gemmobacter straminiformis]